MTETLNPCNNYNSNINKKKINETLLLPFIKKRD